MDIKPIQKVSISDQICNQMKQLILNGVWTPGMKIPSETDLAESFEVSRASIREALMRLTAIGLLESRFSGGTYVREVGTEIYLNAIVPVAYVGSNAVRDVLEFRRVVEAKQAGLAAQKATQEDVGHLEEILRDMERVAGDVEAYSDADSHFHTEIARITQNPLLVACMQLISNILAETMVEIIKIRGFESGIRSHRAIIEAIRENDSEKACALMDQHVEDVCQTFAEVVPKNR